MKNPWTHSDVPSQSSTSSKGMRILSLVVWGFLLIGVIGVVFFASRGMVDIGNVDSVISAISVLLLILVAIPILKKLLVISRLLASLALLVNLWLMFRLLSFQDVQWAQTALDGDPVDAVFDLTFEMFEILTLV